MSSVRAIASFIAHECKGTKAPVPDGSLFLYTVASGLAGGVHDETWSARLFDLMNKSHEQMGRAAAGADLNAWRDFYTLCCVLRGLLQFTTLQHLEAIATLDHAIIIAGTTDRLKLVLLLIQTIQSSIKDHAENLVKDVRSFHTVSSGAPSAALRNTIHSLPPPSFLSFQTNLSETPFILRNFASDWPAMHERPWRSGAYLRSVAGPGRVVPVEVGNDYRSDSWKQKIMPWDDFLSTLDFEDQPASNSASDVLYLAQHDLTVQFPSLRDDINIPDYVYASLTPLDYSNYHPPRNAENVFFNTWLGPKNAMSPAHTDPYYNFYVQVVGYKSVWLAPPSASPSMYPVSSSSTEPHRTTGITEGNATSNTSQVDVFTDSRNGHTTFPDFEENVMPISTTACLGPGDALFFPPGWWHAMRSETTSFSFSMWF